jgi:hypothetical protein
MSTQLEASALDAIYGPNINEFLRYKADPNLALIPAGQQARHGDGRQHAFADRRTQLFARL